MKRISYLMALLVLLTSFLASCKKNPSASFSASTYSTKERVVIQFTNTSTDVDNYLWDFGDSAFTSSYTSTEVNPTHAYDTAGLYLVTLKVFGSNDKKNDVAYSYMTIVTADTIPVTNFSASPTSTTTGDTIHFMDLSKNTPIRWSWNFGDGDTSNVRNPIHNYKTAGNYTISLKASNDAGSNTATKVNYITITN